jgi:DNA mismatch endonuclease, patch repair protein
MQATPQRDTPAELALRRLIHAAGLRYRVDSKPISDSPRRADIVFRPSKVAVFVDGCFWHGCSEHGSWPKSNASFWRRKIEANQDRDRDTDRALRRAGWRVIRVWEHEDPARALRKLLRAVRQRKKTAQASHERAGAR